jgi:ABC-type branched-subunit amino acid transport system substrate-binding protein
MDSIGGAAEQAGIEVTAKASAPRKVSDVSSTVREALSDNPDGVIFTGTLGQVSSALKTIIREGYSTDDVFFTTEVKTSEVFDAVSDTELIEGVHSASASANVQSDVYESFASDYKEQTGRDSVHPYAVTSYDATNAMALAIHHAETTEDGEKIGQSMRKIGNPPGTKVTTFAEGKEALNAGEKINYQGAATPCNFDKQGNVFGPMAHFKATTSAWEINDIFPASEMSEFLEEHRN